MATTDEYPSVDEFVAAYLAQQQQPEQQQLAQQQQQQQQVPQQQQALHGFMFAGGNGLQPSSTSYQQQQQQQQLGVGLQQQYAAPSRGGAAAGGGGDVFMQQQPYDQMMGAYGQQQPQPQQPMMDWQLLQQQQLQLQMLQQQQQHAFALQQQQVQQAATVVSPKAARRGNNNGSTQAADTSAAVSTTATGKRTSRSKGSSSTRGGRKGKEQQQEGVDAAALLSHNLGHTASAPALMHPGAAVADSQQRAASQSFTTGYAQPGNLTSVLLLQQAQAAQQAQAMQQQQRQQLPNAAQQQQAEDKDEPDMSHLTVMQRYHARRKLAVQRMEREVAEKIAQLAALEQENKKLKWQAHILDGMLKDMDVQVALMSTEETPDASQWLTLLGMGTSAAAGQSGVIARALHKMLEGASTVDITGWTAQDCRSKWLACVEQLQPLVEQAEAAQAAHRAAQAASEQQSTGAQQQQPQSRRPRRAAAAAAVAVIKQEAADVLGVAPLPVARVGNIPDVPLPQACSKSLSSSNLAPPSPPSAAAAADQSGGSEQPQDMEGVKRANSESNSNTNAADAQQQQQRSQHPAASEHSAGSMSGGGSELSHGPNVDGVPAALLSKIEDIVLHNFYWLLAIMTRNPVLTYEFISVDLVEGRAPLPPQTDPMWGAAVDRVELTLEQQQECCTCLQVAHRCMAKVIEERAEITAAMQPCMSSPQTDARSLAWMSTDMLNQNQVEGTVERMRANVRKESVVRNLVGFYCINVVSLFQLARLSVSCAPWFSMAWRLCGAVEAKLEQRLAGDGGSGQQQPQQ